MTKNGSFKDAFHHLSEIHGHQSAIRYGTANAPVSFRQLSNQMQSAADDLKQIISTSSSIIAYVSADRHVSAALFLSLSVHSAVAPVPAAMTGPELEAILRLLKPCAVVFDQQSISKADVASQLGIAVLIAHNDGAGQISFEPLGSAHAATTHCRTVEGKGVVLTTSGTTGTPKLVALEADKVFAGARNVARTLGLGTTDIGVEIMPLHHIHGLIAGLLAPLLSGGEVIIQQDVDPVSTLEASGQTGATWYTAVPTMHQAIFRAVSQRPSLANNCHFRLIRSSSSAMPEKVRKGLRSLFNCAVVEAYGMTEATHQISSQSPNLDNNHGNVGQPAAGTLKIADPSGSAVPDGQTGEIMIKSETVIDRYLDNENANRTTFLDGWMKTGDIGVVNADGSLTLVAREKEIIKRGGAQVSPIEIENALLSLPGVSEAIAFGVPHATLEQDAAAAVVIDDTSQCDPRKIRSALLDLLSSYKVPSKFLQLSEIPKSPTGKPRRLEMHTLLADQLKGSYSEPQSPTEDLVSALFEEVLNSGPVGRDDDFFLSGGDSLSGTGLTIQLNELLGISIPAETLFRFPTPAELAAYLEDYDGGRVRELVESLSEDLKPQNDPVK